MMHFSRGLFSPMRMSGFGTGLSKSKLTRIMLDVLLQLPTGTQNLKETIVANMGFLGQMTGVRETNGAWTEVKKKAAREYPDKFLLDERGALAWNDGTKKFLDRKISTATIKKLNALAESEGCDVNEMTLRLLRQYSATKGKR